MLDAGSPCGAQAQLWGGEETDAGEKESTAG